MTYLALAWLSGALIGGCLVGRWFRRNMDDICERHYGADNEARRMSEGPLP